MVARFLIVLVFAGACTPLDPADRRGVVVQVWENEKSVLREPPPDLFALVRDGQSETVLDLLKRKKIDLTARDENGVGLLEAAIVAENDALIEALTYAGVAVDSNVLVSAIRHPDRRLLQFAVRNQTDLDEPDREGRLPLNEAVRWGDPDAVALLLDNGADPYRIDAEGTNALDVADLAENIGRFPDKAYNYRLIVELLTRSP